MSEDVNAKIVAASCRFPGSFSLGFADAMDLRDFVMKQHSKIGINNQPDSSPFPPISKPRNGQSKGK
jgi:hypothetical protein